MTEQLSLVKRADFSNDQAVLDLLPWLNDDGWEMTVGDGVTAVDEALTLHTPKTITSDDDLAAAIQALDAMLVQVDHFENPLEPYGVWLRHQLPGETGARQALVLQAKRGKAPMMNVLARDHYWRDYVLGLKRASAWEATEYRGFGATGLWALGGMADLGYVRGDITARLARMTLNATAGNEPLTKAWLGFRTERFGHAANFTPHWEAEFGTLGADAAIIDDNDATAIGGTEVVYFDEIPELSDNVFALLHSPVKAQSIVVRAFIPGSDPSGYELTDHWNDGILSTWGGTVTGEDATDDNQLNNMLITPTSVKFFGNGREIAHDDGAGVLVLTMQQVTDGWYVSGGPVSEYERDATAQPIIPSTVTGEITHLIDDGGVYHDDGAGLLLYDVDDSQMGTIDYETGHLVFFANSGSTITITYWTNGTGTPGTINYIDGTWALTLPILATLVADYQCGNVVATFNYVSGAGTFVTAGVAAISVTYTSYINRSIRISFTDPSLQPRWSMAVEDASSSPADQAGRMLVLGRFKATDADTICWVRLESGFSGMRAYHRQNKVPVSGDQWLLYPLGYVSFPETGRALSQAIGKQRLRILAERREGTGALDMDFLGLIPTDEGFVSFKGETELYAYLDPLRWPLVITHSADNQTVAIGVDGTGGPLYSDVAAKVEEGLPIGGNMQVVFFGQRNHASHRQDTIDLTIEAYERWITLRGAE